MSKIEKLSVQGVRSFSPTTREYITFTTPLTLIVGYNGSGKTTIIECLKYATTGEQPPNSKGGAFIHDPKLCGEREVLAQVKLKFSTPPETSFVVTRNLQLTVKKATRSMKTLEGSLLTMRHGEKSSVSSKVAELDSVVPESLGVAAAILDNVIFCHQDESLWPMSEPSALKKKFDEIFEAGKYIKAIDNLKGVRKRLGTELDKHKNDEAHEKIAKERADRTERRSVQLQDEIESLRDRIGEMEVEIAEAQRQAKEKHEQATSFLGIVNELESKQELLDYRQEAIQELKETIDELDEADDWLQKTLQQYEERVARYDAELEENKEQYGEHQRELGKTRRDHAEQLAERGKHQSDKEKYERQLESRVELIQQAAQIHSIRGFEGELDDGQARQFSERLQKLVSEKKRELDHLQKENAEEVDRESAKISELEGRKASTTQSRVHAKQRIGALEKRIKSLQNDLNRVDVDEGAKAILDASLQDLEKHLESTMDDFQTADLDTKMRQEGDELSRLEAESDRLGHELMECMRRAKDTAQLDHRREELKKKRRDLDMLVNTWADKLTPKIGSAWTPDIVEEKFQTALQARTKAWEEATRKRDDALQSLKQVQFSLSNTKAKGEQRDDELSKCTSNVLKTLKEVNPDARDKDLDIAMFPEEIIRLEEEILQAEKDISLFKEMTDYYKKCQTTLNKHNKCRLCDRMFVDAGEKSRVVQKLRQAISGEDTQKARDDLQLAEEDVGKLRTVRPQYETYLRLTAGKPELHKEIQALKEKETVLLRQLEDLDEIVNGKLEERQDVESMSKTVSSIAQIHSDIGEAQAHVDRIMSQQAASGTLRSADEVKEAQTSCSEQMRNMRNKITRYQNEKQRMRDLINGLEVEKGQLKLNISKASQQLENRKSLQTQIQTLKDDMGQQKETIQQADRELEGIEPQIAKARTIRDDTLRRGRAKEKKVADERDALVASLNELKTVESDIRDYLDRGGPSNLATNERAIQALNKTISRIEKDMSDLIVRTNKLKEEIGDSARKKKNIQDNLNYRKNLRQVNTLKHDIAELQSRNATEDYERTITEARQFESTRDALNAERGAMKGAMKTKDDELAHLLQEWETDYKNAAQKYRKAHIEVETTKAAIEDLQRYGAALDKAVMQYHSLKMEEINRIAGELWTKTYQGTDIDSVLIRADSDTSSHTGTRKNYNYRVCMVKQDTEMDMRGRCSAGQKVLASIIIRLALAESFGINCGLIALDEPTTNLDSDNIRSLAESLHDIIKLRQSQSNFQLIVITHDEEFLRHMKCSDFCDSFHRVKRDDKQNSVIIRENISRVSG